MTEQNTPTASQETSPQRRTRPLGAVGGSISRRLAALQAAHLAGAPSARAQLAQLRRGVGRQPGDLPEIWEVCVGDLPAELSWTRDEPTRAEAACHAAFTLYATHQQSLTGPAHVPGVSLGSALARLRDDSASGAAVTRRFMAVATAQTADELLVHVRGLVTQLRTKQIGMDYAMFADDVADLLNPYRAAATRLRWGRDYYRRHADPSAPKSPQPVEAHQTEVK